MTTTDTQHKELLQILQGTWSQLDPDHRAAIKNHRAVLDDVVKQLFPGGRELRVVRGDHGTTTARSGGVRALGASAGASERPVNSGRYPPRG